MVKATKSPTRKKSRYPKIIFTTVSVILTIFVIVSVAGIYRLEKMYQGKIFPGIRIDGIAYGGKTPVEVASYFETKSKPFGNLQFTLNFEDNTATLSGRELAIGFDGQLLAAQAYSIGRSGHILSDIYQRWKAYWGGINLPSVLKMNTDVVDELATMLAASIDIAPEDALFQFDKGKVTAFRLSKAGRALNREQTKQTIHSYIVALSRQDSIQPQNIPVTIPVDIINPAVTTDNSNTYGVRELLGRGTSTFFHSIPGRVHNVALAANRLNGHLVAPGSIFSFNDALGDVSGSTGFQPAYIIKDGRTVLGDGGGVCQVSTTLFRAILSAGLPVTERHAHAYRVGYYEQDAPPGLDATVFAPSYDLKFENDTSYYILIQSQADTANYALSFELYGTNDGRKSEMTKPVILSQIAPPPDLYQDDPTIPNGVVKQVDFAAWGAKVTFDYKVTRNGQEINKQTFFSNFRPWQAVYLRGTAG